ncbi:MAG: hypothetical protein E7663_04700 [Ruminococcaceae bacterium]|nr:hypothetical protein [Oscillospiraceae bacterium]
MGKYDIQARPSLMAEATAKTEHAAAYVGGRIKNSIDGILIALVVTVEILMQFAVFSLNTAFSWQDVIFAISEAGTTILAFYVFVPSGKNGRTELASYQTASTSWREACKRLRDASLLSAFREFCKRCSAADIAEEREAALEHLENLYVSRADFNEKYRTLSKKALKRCRRSGEISREAYRQILVCRAPVQSKPYKADLILNGTDRRQATKGLKEGDHYEAVNIALKPIFCVLWVFVNEAAQIASQCVENGLLVVISIVMSILGVCFSAFMGYRLGWSVVAREEKFINARIAFIDRFCEENRAPTAK